MEVDEGFVELRKGSVVLGLWVFEGFGPLDSWHGAVRAEVVDTGALCVGSLIHGQGSAVRESR